MKHLNAPNYNHILTREGGRENMTVGSGWRTAGERGIHIWYEGEGVKKNLVTFCWSLLQFLSEYCKSASLFSHFQPGLRVRAKVRTTMKFIFEIKVYFLMEFLNGLPCRERERERERESVCLWSIESGLKGISLRTLSRFRLTRLLPWEVIDGCVSFQSTPGGPALGCNLPHSRALAALRAQACSLLSNLVALLHAPHALFKMWR